LVAALSQGQGLSDALRLASAAGALACTRLGAQTSIPTRDEVLDFLKQQAPATSKQVALLKQFCGFDH
jgi:ribokinase